MKVVVAGGGVAGAAAACLLGPDALLIERERAPHDKICGEFVSAEAQPYLARMGLDLAALGAVPIDRLRLVHGDTVIESPLPFRAHGLSRRTLDAALLDRAAALGAEVVRGHVIRSLRDGVLEVDGLGTLRPEAVFLATGKHELRGVRRPGRPGNTLIGLKMYFALDPAQQAALRGCIEVLLFPGGYAGLQMIEGGAANLCLLIDQDRFAAAGRSWDGVQAMLERGSAHLRRRLQGGTRLLDRPLTVARIPYGFVHQPGPADPPGLYRLGDQAGVIPSFSGDGMCIALHSAVRAVAAHRRGGAEAFHRGLKRDIARQVGRAMAIDRLGRAAPRLLLHAARLWPGILPLAARLTRLPNWAGQG